MNSIVDFWVRSKKVKSGCWVWQGNTCGNDRYGKWDFKAQKWLAHRFAYFITHGSLDRHMHVLHKCDNGLCVNPDHLFLGTHRDNMLDMVSKNRHGQKSRTHCPQGHRYSRENTYITKQGWRHCRICSRRRFHEWYDKKKAA